MILGLLVCLCGGWLVLGFCLIEGAVCVDVEWFLVYFFSFLLFLYKCVFVRFVFWFFCFFSFYGVSSMEVSGRSVILELLCDGLLFVWLGGGFDLFGIQPVHL